jgi:hypothetical protein
MNEIPNSLKQDSIRVFEKHSSRVGKSKVIDCLWKKDEVLSIAMRPVETENEDRMREWLQ